MPSQREARVRAADAQRRDTSTAAAAGFAAVQDPNAVRGGSTRSRSSEPWDTPEGSSRSKRGAATATGSSNRRASGRSRHGPATVASSSAEASSSGIATNQRRQSGDYGRRSGGGGIRSSSIVQQLGASPDRRRGSNCSFDSNCSDEQEDEATCPLCLEALDETDRGLFPCECGYQVCLWCLHHIRDHLANKCPACRRDYDEKKFKYDQSRVVELTKQIGRKSRDKVCGSSEAMRSGSSGGCGSSSSRSACATAARGGAVSSLSGGIPSSSSCSSRGLAAPQHGGGAARRGSREAAAPTPAQAAALKDVRVIQRCLVYVIGIPPSIAKKEILRRHEFFGRYGKVLQIVVNKNQGHWGGPSFAVYVTYSTSKEAVAAIQGVDGAVYEGRTLKASFGTTKYCSHFLKGVKCQNPDCSYLHQLGSGKDSFTKEAMISAKHQFLDLTFPNASERKQTASLFGKLSEPGSRSTQKEQTEGHGDSAANEGAGPGSESDASDASASSPARASGKGGAATTVSAPCSAPPTTGVAAAASHSTAGEAEDLQNASRGAKSKSKPQDAPCSTWASVAAGCAKPSATPAVAGAATSASSLRAASPASGQGKSQHPAASSVTARQPMQLHQQQQEQQQQQQLTEGLENEIPRPEKAAAADANTAAAADGNTSAKEVLPESASQEVERQPLQAKPPELPPSSAGKADAPAKEEENPGDRISAIVSPADADDEGILGRQQQEQQQQTTQHEQQEPPQQPPSWPAFHPDFPQRPLGAPLVAAGLQGALLDSVGVPMLPSAAAGGAPQPLQPLLPAQQQQRTVQQLEQHQRRLAALQLEGSAPFLSDIDGSSLSAAEQLMQQLQEQQQQQQQHQQLRPCAAGRLLPGMEPMEPGGGRFGPPPGLEALGEPNSNRECSARSQGSSSSSSRANINSFFDPPGSLLGQLGTAGSVGALPFSDDSSLGAPGATSTSSSRFAFASSPDGEEDALFEIPGVEDCLLWLASPSTHGNVSAEEGTTAAQQQPHQGALVSNGERPSVLDTNANGEPLPLTLGYNWAQQQRQDFVFGPGVGGTPLPTVQQQQQQQQQRQPPDRWRQSSHGQLPPALMLQAKAIPGAAPPAPGLDRFDVHNARRAGGWSNTDRFGVYEQQQQLQHEQLQQLLRQQQQMIVQQQQQQQARARAAALSPAPPEQQLQQQPQLFVHQRQQQQQQQQQQQLALLQQLLPAACALGRGGSAPSADPEEALKLLLSLIPNPAGQAHRLPLPPQQQQQQFRFNDNSSSHFAVSASGSRDTDATARMRAARGGHSVLPRSHVGGGAPGGPTTRGVDEGTDGSWGAGAAAAASSESARGRSAARRPSASSVETTDRGAVPGCGSYPHFDTHISEASPFTGGTGPRGGVPGGPTDAGTMPLVCNPPSLHSGSELLPFLQRQRMQQIQQQQLQQLQRALESQRLE